MVNCIKKFMFFTTVKLAVRINILNVLRILILFDRCAAFELLLQKVLQCYLVGSYGVHLLVVECFVGIRTVFSSVVFMIAVVAKVSCSYFYSATVKLFRNSYVLLNKTLFYLVSVRYFYISIFICLIAYLRLIFNILTILTGKM